MALIEACNIGKVFRRRSGAELKAIDGVSFAIAAGSMLGVQGPSGAGKSTLLSLIAGIDRVTSGELLFDGIRLHAASDIELARIRRRIGMVFQDYALLPQLSLVENIACALIPRRVPRYLRRRRAIQWLERLELAELADTRASELSGGECQRLAVARAMAGEPDVLLADEPTSNLDQPTAARVIEVLLQFHAAGGTIVVASHDSEIISHANEVLTLEKGQSKVADRSER